MSLAESVAPVLDLRRTSGLNYRYLTPGKPNQLPIENGLSITGGQFDCPLIPKSLSLNNPYSGPPRRLRATLSADQEARDVTTRWRTIRVKGHWLDMLRRKEVTIMLFRYRIRPAVITARVTYRIWPRHQKDCRV